MRHESPAYVVYQALHLATGRMCAIKTTRKAPTPDATTALEHEFDALRRLSGSFAPKAYELLRPEKLFLVLEWIDGADLESIIRSKPPLPRAIALASMILKAVDDLHASGFLHLDLKPANILIRPTGAAALIDFALAQPIGPPVAPPEQPFLLQGTLSYMAPEQTGWLDAPIDRRADYYALGVIFYELFVGATPFAAQTFQELLDHVLHSVPAEPIDLPLPLNQLIMQLLAKHPDQRPGELGKAAAVVSSSAEIC
ncbi:MAG: hypothetical protein A2X46_18465 [Lentisphaerae bacterium GWF2_57_35]|nr:MAG: hypothetical protein A2X46_18465 [Lentisphaerae bacterium GWF2_57_35]